MERSSLHVRLERAAGDRSYRHLAELTDIHPETVRRYMQGHAPSVEFLAGICASLGVNAAWLLNGQGPMFAAEVKGHVLKSAAPTDLLAAMAEQVEALKSRLERLELYVQTLEARLWAGASSAAQSALAPRGGAASHAPLKIECKHGPGETAGERAGIHGQPPAHPASDRIADAVAKRPPEAAG